MTDVVYNLFSEGDVAIAQGHTMLLPPWAGMASNAEGVAAAICEEHLDERTWTESRFCRTAARPLFLR